MVLAILGLMFGHNLAIFSGCMFVLGVMSGITMSIGTHLITHIYEGKQRGSRLLFTDSFFSMAGMIFPVISAALLARRLEWYWVYVAIGGIYLAIFVLTLIAKFPVLGKKDEEEFEVLPEKEKWGLGVAFLAIAALCYILGQLGFVFLGSLDYAAKDIRYTNHRCRSIGELLLGLHTWSVCGSCRCLTEKIRPAALR